MGHGFIINPGAGGPFEHLLRDEVNNLCLSCHDGGGFAPDVLGAAGAAGTVRLGGYLNRLGVEGLAATGHTLDSLEEAPGSDPVWKPEDENGAGKGLNCINCHHQHGYGRWVQLVPQPEDEPGQPRVPSELWSRTTTRPSRRNDLTKDVYERAAGSYDESDVDWNEPDPTNSKIGTWCMGCHTNFHGQVGDANNGR